MMRLFSIALVAVIACSCATSSQNGVNERSQSVTLDPMLVSPDQDGVPGEAVDVEELFERAYTAFGNRRYEAAAINYQKVVRFFPETRFFLSSAYNAGLAFEKIERYADAEAMYLTIIENDPGAAEAKDAYYRRAAALKELGRHSSIVEVMTQVLLRNDLSTFDRIEAHVRRADALVAIGNLEEAADGFRTAIRLNDEAPPNEQLSSGANYIVQSYFGLGRVHHMRVEAIKLRLPPERMGVDLEEKADYFMRAQSSYIRALGFHHPQWSMAAGYMIGKLYEDFYVDIFTAEIPDDLSNEAIELYFEELRKQIRPLMVRAVQVYEKNLSLSKRIAQSADDNEWVAHTQVRLDRMRAYLDDADTRRRAERFALRGQSFEEMWQPVPIARDTVDVAVVAGLAGVAASVAPEESADPEDDSEVPGSVELEASPNTSLAPRLRRVLESAQVDRHRSVLKTFVVLLSGVD